MKSGCVRAGSLGDVAVELTVHSMSQGELTASVRYVVDDHTWAQDFTAVRLDGDTLDAALAECGLGPGTLVTVSGQEHPDWIASAPSQNTELR